MRPLLMGLHPKVDMQCIFGNAGKPARSGSLTNVVDALNRKIGAGSLTIAASGTKQL